MTTLYKLTCQCCDHVMLVEEHLVDDMRCDNCGHYPMHAEVFVDDDVYLSDDEHDQFNSDAEADADVLRSAGWGTDEDYGYYGDDSF
jgi:hypothetical protein